MAATIRVILTGLTVLALGSAAGCSKKAAGPDASKIAGTWIEVKEQVSPRFKGPDTSTNELKKMTINADKTFKLEICGPDGNPIAGQTASGTWKLDNSGFVFETGSNSLDEAHKNRVPQTSTGPAMFPVGGSTQERLLISHEDGPATYKRQ